MALFAACTNGHEAIVKLLLSQDDIDVNIKATESLAGGYRVHGGQTALSMACCWGHIEVVKLLLSRNDVTVDEGIVELLLSRNDNSNSQDSTDSQAAFRFAASHEDYEAIIKLLLSQNRVAQDKNGQTALSGSSP